MTVAILVPVRKGSTRLRNKALVKLAGAESIRWTLAAGVATGLPTYVVTDCAGVLNATADMDLAGRIYCDDPAAITGTDRASIAVRKNFSDANFTHYIVLAGDEPCADPGDLLRMAKDAGGNISTLVTANGVATAVTTVYLDPRGYIDGFRRHDTPGEGERAGLVATGIYCYPALKMLGYSMCPQPLAELQTGIELQRFYAYGERVKAIESKLHPGYGLNTKADVALCSKWLRDNRLQVKQS